jgi:hypothetical protein
VRRCQAGNRAGRMILLQGFIEDFGNDRTFSFSTIGIFTRNEPNFRRNRQEISKLEIHRYKRLRHPNQ